jgi:hypothetical protein
MEQVTKWLLLSGVIILALAVSKRKRVIILATLISS